MPPIKTATLTPLTAEQMEAICQPRVSANSLIALLKMHAMTFNRPLATVTRDWIDAVVYGQTSETIELLCNSRRWIERCGNGRFRITESGVEAARSIITHAGGLK